MEYSERKIRMARKRVEALKCFYQHLFAFLLVNGFLFIVKGLVLDYFLNSNSSNFMEWINWNILIVPVLWGIGLLYHAANVFHYKIPFIKKWEDRKLEKFLQEEASNSSKK